MSRQAQELRGSNQAATMREATEVENLETEETKIVEYDLKLQDAVTSLQIRVEALEPPAPVQQNTQAVATATTKHRMPELELTKFSGDPLLWEAFWDDFRCSVDDRTDISVIDKFKLLKQCLQDEAAEMVISYHLTVNNYQQVKNALAERFGDPQVAISAHLEALLELKPASLETSQLVKVRDKCEAHVRSLIALGLDESSFGQIYAPVILSKVPKLVKMDINRRNGAKAWTLAALREALKEEIQIRTKSENKKPDGDEKETQWKKSEPWKKQHASASALLNQTSQPKSGSRYASPKTHYDPCIFCGSKDHRNWQCQTYPDVQSRLERVRGRCGCCLNRFHQKSECRSTRSCYYCQSRDHNGSFCPVQFSQSEPGQQHAESGAASQDNANFVHTKQVLNPSMPAFSPATVNAVQGPKPPAQWKGRSLSGTAVKETAKVLIIGQRTRCTARAVFDSGSTMSFITSKMVRKIGANPIGYDYRALGKFGDATRTETRYSTFEFKLQLKDGSQLGLEMNAVEHVSTPLTLVPLDIEECLQYCDKSELAETLVDQPTEVEIDILIGLDYYHHFMGGKQWRCKNGLVLKETKVGYIVTGFMKNPPVTKEPAASAHHLLVCSTLGMPFNQHHMHVTDNKAINTNSKCCQYPKANAGHADFPRCLPVGANLKPQKADSQNCIMQSYSRLILSSGGSAKRHHASKVVESVGMHGPFLTPSVGKYNSSDSGIRHASKADESMGTHDPILSPSAGARSISITSLKRQMKYASRTFHRRPPDKRTTTPKGN